ncbi:MAG: hypothetical protein JWO98_2519 [Frankiales bacterium]|nr:hypothetical protein [Frankiales bacterium]
MPNENRERPLAELRATALLEPALTDGGREREGLALALTACAQHLPRYRRSVADYPDLLLEEAPATGGRP